MAERSGAVFNLIGLYCIVWVLSLLAGSAWCFSISVGEYSHAPQNDVSVNDGPHIRRWSHKIIIL